LIKDGRPALEIANQCFGLFKEGQKKLILKEVDTLRKERMQYYCNDTEFEKVVTASLQQGN
jgi:hypothetical protein